MRAGSIIVTALTLGLGGCNDDGSCGGSVETYCAGGTTCPLTWTAAHDLSSWTSTVSPCNEGMDAVQLFTCSEVLVAHVKHVDTGETYYFAPRTGELYRVDHDTIVVHQSKCVVGDGPAEACDDPNPVLLCLQP
jgi:hypothetical protein